MAKSRKRPAGGRLAEVVDLLRSIDDGIGMLVKEVEVLRENQEQSDLGERLDAIEKRLKDLPMDMSLWSDS